MTPAGSATALDAIVVGAGWAGLTAAVGLLEQGARVALIDAAPEPGGRARTQRLTLGTTPVQLDNGQHLLVGAYRSTLALLQRIGVDPDAVLVRAPLDLRSVDGLAMQARPWPGRLALAGALLTARGLPVSHRLAMAWLLGTLPPDRPSHWPVGLNVLAWLHSRAQPPELIARLWAPLCTGTLNTAMEQACARTFARVLRDTLAGPREASDTLLARRTLGEVLPRPAVAWLAARGASIHLRSPCRRLDRLGDGRWQIELDHGPVQASQIVLAVPPARCAALLDGHADASVIHAMRSLPCEPIATVWLGWRERLALPDALLLRDDPAGKERGQWLFDRSTSAAGDLRSLAGVVISAAGQPLGEAGALAAPVARQVCRQLSLPPPAAARAVVDRHATVRCIPDRPRIAPDAVLAACPGVALAGDWIWHDYPSTLEGAVRSGDAAAALLGQGGP